MPRQFKPHRKDLNLDRMFETRSDAWERVGLSIDVDERDIERSRRNALVLTPLLIAVIVGYNYVNDNDRWRPLGHGWPTHLETPITVVASVAVLAIGWGVARAVGKSAGPTFMRRLDPATAGTVGFLIRLVTMAIALVAALSVAGVTSQTLAVGGAFTAVIFGLAAQQTLGNVFAGMVLLSARSFRVGDRVRLQAGALGGALDGTVTDIGITYVRFDTDGSVMSIPNSQVLNAVVGPIPPDEDDAREEETAPDGKSGVPGGPEHSQPRPGGPT